MQKYSKILSKMNLSRLICEHLVKDKHTQAHRNIVGTVIMVIGVGIVHLSHGFNSILLIFVSDVSGYLLHGIGAVPFIESILKRESNE